MGTTTTRVPRPASLRNRRSIEITANASLERALRQLEYAFRVPFEGYAMLLESTRAESGVPGITDVASFVLLKDAELHLGGSINAGRKLPRRLRAAIAQRYRLTEFEGLFKRSEIEVLRAFIAGRSAVHIPVVQDLIADLSPVSAERLIENLELASYAAIGRSDVPRAADRRLLDVAGIDNLAVLSCVRLQDVASANQEHAEAVERLRPATNAVVRRYALDPIANSAPISSVPLLRAWLAGARSDVTLLIDAVPAINRTVRAVSVIGALDAVLSTLTDRERLVLEMRFGLVTGSRPTLRQVGQRVGVHASAIGQVQHKAITKLNSPPRRRRVLRAIATVSESNAASPGVPLRTDYLHTQMSACGMNTGQIAGATELVATLVRFNPVREAD